MVYFGPLRNTWLRLICTHPVGRGIPNRRSSIELIFKILPRDALQCKVRSCCRMSSVCPSVRLSVTLVDHDRIGWKSWKVIARSRQLKHWKCQLCSTLMYIVDSHNFAPCMDEHNLFCSSVWSWLPSVLWLCWLGIRKSIRPVKNWVMGCWRGYLSGVCCKWFAYGSADDNATPSSVA